MAAGAGTDPAPFHHVRRNRTPRNIALLAAVYAALAAAVLVFDAARWLVAFLGLFTLPALWDVLAGTTAELLLGARHLSWRSGAREGDVPLAQIARVRLDTRWDLSIRATLILQDGARIRLPQECMPPHRGFGAALHQRGLRVERHHFVVF